MKKLSVILLGVMLLSPATSAIAGKDNVFFGNWLSSTAPIPPIAPMLEGREGYCLGKVGNRIYMTHGMTFSGDTGHVRIYDIAMDMWFAGTSSPNPRAEGVGVSHDGLVYAIGGRYAGAGVLSLMEAYDPVTDSWATLSPMNTARAGLAAAVVGNKIYTFGGRAATGGPCSGLPLNVAEVFDIATDTWSPITPPPTPVTDATAVAKGGKIYLIGGCDSVGVTDNLQIYSPNTDTWATGSLMPTPRASLAAAVLGDTVYAIGGLDSFIGNLNVVEAYDIDKDMWAGPLAPKTTSASEIYGAAHGGVIYVPGSGSFGIALNIFEAFKRK